MWMTLKKKKNKKNHPPNNENYYNIMQRIISTLQWVAKTSAYCLQWQLVVILEMCRTTKNLLSVNPRYIIQKLNRMPAHLNWK